MTTGMPVRTTAWQTYAFVLPPNQIFVKGYQTARNKCAVYGGDRPILKGGAIPTVACDHLVDGPPAGRPKRMPRAEAAHWQQTALNVSLRNPEQPPDLVFAVQVQSRDARPVAAGVQRQFKVPHRWKDGSVQRGLVKRL